LVTSVKDFFSLKVIIYLLEYMFFLFVYIQLVNIL